MHLNWLAYNWRSWDGYGRFSVRFVEALERSGVAVHAECVELLHMPGWMRERLGVPWQNPTISCLPPYFVAKLPDGAGPHWLFTMTEGSECPKGWAKQINDAGVDRLIVPCEHNADVFRRGGVSCPVSVIPGGTDPQEFPLITERPNRPYTFLTIADRGKRKGWSEVYEAFFKAFGGTTTGIQDVRLIVKCRPEGNDLVDFVTSKVADIDPRLSFVQEDMVSLRDLFAKADCVALPSRTEGWGMPHREAAMMGLPVIVQKHSGLDDGNTEQWAIVLEKGRLQPIEDEGKHIAGEWMVADTDELAQAMRACYDDPEKYERHGFYAHKWLASHQTWDDSVDLLVALMKEHGALEPEVEREKVLAWPI